MICFGSLWSTALISSWSHRTIFFCPGTMSLIMFYLLLSGWQFGVPLLEIRKTNAKMHSMLVKLWQLCLLDPFLGTACCQDICSLHFKIKTHKIKAYLNSTNWWALYERIHGYTWFHVHLQSGSSLCLLLMCPVCTWPQLRCWDHAYPLTPTQTGVRKMWREEIMIDSFS